MRIVALGAERRVGVLDGDRVVDLGSAHAARLRDRGASAAGNELPVALDAFIEAGPRAIELAHEAVAFVRDVGPATGPDGAPIAVPLGEAEIRAPWPRRRIACQGANFAEHGVGFVTCPGVPPPTVEEVRRSSRDDGQWGFWKVPTDVPDPGERVPYPSRTSRFDYEGELAIVLARRGNDVDPTAIDGWVWGVTLAIDWSIRDEAGVSSMDALRMAKNFDGSISLGPCIVVGDVDPADVEVETRVNGELRQRFSTRDMIWSLGEILAHLSRDFTLVPGDVVCTGTGAGTAADSSERLADGSWAPDRFLRRGDTVEVASPAIGVLASGVRA